MEPVAAAEVAVNAPRLVTRRGGEQVRSHELRSAKKTRTEATIPPRRELPSTSMDHVLRITTSQAGDLFRCQREAIHRNIPRWEDIRPIRATWERLTRDLPAPDIQERPTRRHPIRTLELMECNPVILHNVRTTIPAVCTMVSDLRG